MVIWTKKLVISRCGDGDSVWNKGFFCPGYACIMDMSLKVNMYNGHVLEGKLCITDMYLKVNNFIPDMKVKVSHV